MSPHQNSASRPLFTSLQPHHEPLPRAPSKALAGSGPRAAISARSRVRKSGCSRRIAATWRHMPTAPRARSIRQRISGCVSSGSSDASWPQYSKSSRSRPYAARSSRAGS